MKIMSLIILATLLFCSSLLRAGSELPVFSDNFDTAELFAENWTTTGKAISRNKVAYIPDGDGSLTLRKAIPENFSLSVKVIIHKAHFEESAKRGFAGIAFGNFTFYLSTRGSASFTYRVMVDGKRKAEGSSAKVVDFTFGKPYELKLEVRRQEKGDLYSVYLDGEKLRSYTLAPNPENEAPRLYSTRAETSFDDFKVSKLTDQLSPNLIVNSSFEYLQEGRPLFYNLQTSSAPNYDKFEQFLNTVQVDTTDKVDGKQSLKMIYDDATVVQGIMTHKNTVAIGLPYTFSIYLKADRDDVPVTLYTWEHYKKRHMKKVNVGKEWKRYEINVPSSTSATVVCGIREMGKRDPKMPTPTTIWLDALQLEQNDKVTEYSTSSLDADFFGQADRQLPSVSPVQVKKAAKAPELNADLDSWIGGAAKFGEFYTKDIPAAEKTEAYAACDNDNLYIGVRAYVKDLSKVKKDVLERDSFNIFRQDNIEILLDPGKSTRNYYQLVVSAANSNIDCGFGRDKAWNGNWTSAVKLNAAKNSIDYTVKIPFGMTGGNGGAVWGINICRFDTASQSASCTMPTNKIDFHQSKSFPEIQLPEELLKKYELRINSATISDSELQLEIENGSGKEAAGNLTLLTKSEKELAGRDVLLKPGKNQFMFRLPESQDSLIVNLGELISRRSVAVTKTAPLTLISRYNIYSENDKNAVYRITYRQAEPERAVARILCGDVKTEAKAASEFTMELPLEKIGIGKHEVRLEVLRDGKVVASAKETLDKRKNAERRINYFRQNLEWRGKPILPFMLNLSAPKSDTNNEIECYVDFLDRSGIRSCLLFVIPSTLKNSLKFIELASKRGIGIIVWTDVVSYTEGMKRGNPIIEDAFRKGIAEFAQYGNIIAFMVLDEPELRQSSEVTAAAMKQAREIITDYPIFMNNTRVGIPNRHGNNMTDIVMIDEYVTTYPGKNLKNIMESADMLVEAGKEKRQPRFFFLVGNNAHNHYREPSRAEQVVQTWAVVIKGCTGLAYFMGVPYWPGNWQGFIQVKQELEALSDVVLDEEDVSPAHVSNPEVLSMTRKHGKDMYVFLVNIDGAPKQTTITLPADYRYANQAEQLFEKSEAISVKDNSFRIELPAESRGIYKIAIQ